MAKKYIQTEEDRLEEFKKLCSLLKSEYEKNPTSKTYSVTNEKSSHVDIKDEEKMHIYFTPEAFAKQTMLVFTNKLEVQWYGLVDRISDREFIIKDILVFKQTVTSASIDSDEEEFREWVEKMDIETVQAMRYNGHSHVKMGVSPSTTDYKYQQRISEEQIEDSFFIFAIWNQELNSWFCLYDRRTNLVYNKDEIVVDILLDDGSTIGDYVEESNKLVVPASSETVKTKKSASRHSNNTSILPDYADHRRGLAPGYWSDLM